jgi:osmotically-inducible protein OsmY
MVAQKESYAMSEDAALLAKVKEALEKDEAMPHHRLHLRAVGGVIFLDGEVDNDEEREAVQAFIKAIEGVKFVQNRLQVNPSDTPELHKPHNTMR